jgi:hypothetical protein
MKIDLLFQLLTLLFGGTTVLSVADAWNSRKAKERSERAKATSDEADSIKATGEIYAYLTEITRRELSTMAEKIEKLETIVEEYKLKCGECALNKKK